ncbi:MAG: hydantoinase B/oxoprolinase family protein, partial [Dehalococcoidia bacterium]
GRERLTHPLHHDEIPKVDPITFEIILNRLQSTCQEMGVTVHRAAHTPIFAESKDFSCALFDHEGHMIAMGEFLPGHQGGMQNTLEGVIKEIGLEGFGEGDIIMTNDALYGGSHPPDINLFHPIYYQGEFLGIAGVLVHHIDMGGMAPSSYVPQATEIYQEGIRFPPTTKLYEGGKLRRDILNIWLTNIRAPEVEVGDMMAQVSGCYVGARRVGEIAERYGVGLLKDTFIAIQHYSANMMREVVRAMPDGVYEGEDYLDGDGVDDTDYRVKCTMRVEGDRVVMDLTGTDRQAKGFVNSHWGVTSANCYSTAMTFAPADMPRNYGATVPFEIVSKEGTVVNALRTAPIGGSTTESGYAVYNAVYSCLSQAFPALGTGAWGGTAGVLLIWGNDPRDGRYYATLLVSAIASGGGARAGEDGWPVASLKVSNLTLPNIEIEEAAWPIRYSYRRLRAPEGGDRGQGRFRGGPGLEFELVPVDTEISFTYLGNKFRHPPEGIQGARNGILARMEVRDRETGRVKAVLPSKLMAHTLAPDEALHIAVAGGGGYGSPLERDPERVLEDIRDGYTSPQEAREVYGVIVDAGMGHIDGEATRELRKRLLAGT